MRRACLLLLLMSCTALSSRCARAQDAGADARQQYEALAKSTRLTGPGQSPFHLLVEAQLFTLFGKPSEKATIEEWWASPTRYRIEIKSPEVTETLSSSDKGRTEEPSRRRYLLRHLLE